MSDFVEACIHLATRGYKIVTDYDLTAAVLDAWDTSLPAWERRDARELITSICSERARRGVPSCLD